MTHRLLIDYYTAHKRHISCFLVPFFSTGDFLSVVDVFFFTTGVPVEEITPSQKETSGFINYKYKNQIFPSAKNGPWGPV